MPRADERTRVMSKECRTQFQTASDSPYIGRAVGKANFREEQEQLFNRAEHNGQGSTLPETHVVKPPRTYNYTQLIYTMQRS